MQHFYRVYWHLRVLFLLGPSTAPTESIGYESSSPEYIKKNLFGAAADNNIAHVYPFA
jgi:hypothetical protein